MPIEKFRDTNFRQETRDRIDQLETILGEYDQKLTSRQVFYQFVRRLWFENTERNYKMITSLVTDARYAGLIDWGAIEDRTREPSIPLEFEDLDHRLESAIANYRLARWRGQRAHVELWVEKDALAGVLAPIASRWHVPLVVNRGYSSASAMKESADRMRDASGARTYQMLETECNEELADLDEDSDEYKKGVKHYAKRMSDETRGNVVLYLGDHDPSGEDMVRDIEDRLKEFRVHRLEVWKIALTMEQIKKHKPPPNPAKITDSRAAAYISKYGDKSWELDALPPRELTRLVEAAINSIVDGEKMKAVIAEEERDKELLRKAVSKLRKAR